ncbi:MAG: hypothetical protein JSV15_06770 [Candidatus Bathyarchaeota archaeon]|nr:MAG: hypothetical protein JSV15_06770 [Candidatus Bathyarchaeota archaeon]
MDPPSAMGVVGTNITVNLDISNAHDVFGWQIYMEWNPSVLKFIEIVQGDFLNKLKETTTEELLARPARAWITTSKMDKYIGSCLVYRLSESKFTLLVGETLLGRRPGVSGNGTLCSAIFQVVTSGDSVIKIDKGAHHRTMALDSSLQEAPVTTQNGFFSETNNFNTGAFNADIVTLGFLSILLPATLLLPAKLKSMPKYQPIKKLGEREIPVIDQTSIFYVRQVARRLNKKIKA